jgi:hypothetical protein
MISAATSAQPPTTLLSPEARLAFAPAATYPVLLAQPGARLWQRVGMFLLVVAVAIPIAAVQRVTIGLVAATAIAWSFIVGIQLAVGSIVILSAPSRRIGLSRALDLWFAGHFPYSLWLLAVAVLMSNLQGSLELIIVLAIAPSLWTAAIVSAFCRIVLGCSPRGARWRAAIHLLAVWAIGLEYVALSVGGWFQITGAATRFFE